MTYVDFPVLIAKRSRRQIASNETSKLPHYYANFVSPKRLYLELAIVFDLSTYEKYGKNKEILQDRAGQLATVVNSVFQPLNIRVALVGVEVWSTKDAFPLRENGEDALRDFVHYRQHVLSRKMANDVAVLITSVKFKAGVVGRGLQGTICSAKSSGAMASDHSHDVFTMAITIAHELGHNFGMPHDRGACECAADACIMAPTVRASHAIYWSTCSLEHLQHTLEHGGGACLVNPPSAILNGPLCGNGFVEEGEQCDCGLPHMCDNACCDARTCKLVATARCAQGDCCDLSTCQLRPSAAVCRSPEDECDLAEYCNGTSEHCPGDTFKHDGELCSNGDAQCYAGRCGSLLRRCQQLWGHSGRPAHHFCYSANNEGTQNGNCGMNRLNNTFVKCAPQDMKCGLLQCEHKNEKTLYGGKSTSIMGSVVITHGSAMFHCQTALIDVGDDRTDPGLVPNGAPCGPGKMCVEQKCVTVSSVRSSNNCQNDCSGHGVCNNFGHCHCDVGYGGLDCSTGGLGGSLQSGPASTSGASNAGVALAVLFFVVLPIVLAAFVYLHRKGLLRRFHFKRERLLKVIGFNRSPSRKVKARKVSDWVTRGTAANHQASDGRVRQNSYAVSAQPKYPPTVNHLKVGPKVLPNNAAPVFKFSTLQSTFSEEPLFPNNTLRRSTERPNVPAPPRPPSPTRLSGERVYCEIHPVGSPSVDLATALSALSDPEAVIPQRRAPPPPPPLASPTPSFGVKEDAQRSFGAGKQAATLDRSHGSTVLQQSKCGSMTLDRNRSCTGSQRRPQQAPPPPPPKPCLTTSGSDSNSTQLSNEGGSKVAELAAKFASR